MAGKNKVADDKSTTEVAEAATQATTQAVQDAKPAETQQPAQSQTAQPNHGAGPGAQILAALESLPERVATAVREAIPAPVQSKPAKTAEKGSETVTKPAEKTQGPQGEGLSLQQKFVRWWGG